MELTIQRHNSKYVSERDNSNRNGISGGNLEYGNDLLSGSARSNLTDQYNVVCPENQGLLPPNPDFLIEFGTLNELPLTVATEFCQYVHEEGEDASDLILYSYFGNFETGTVLDTGNQQQPQQQLQLQLETDTTTCAIGAGLGCNVVTQTLPGKTDRFEICIIFKQGGRIAIDVDPLQRPLSV